MQVKLETQVSSLRTQAFDLVIQVSLKTPARVDATAGSMSIVNIILDFLVAALALVCRDQIRAFKFLTQYAAAIRAPTRTNAKLTQRATISCTMALVIVVHWGAKTKMFAKPVERPVAYHIYACHRAQFASFRLGCDHFLRRNL